MEIGRAKTQKETFEQATLEAFREVERTWNGTAFVVPADSFGNGYMENLGFYEMFMRHFLVKKGEITEEQKGLMIEHNKKLLNKLKEMGWQEPAESLYPNPEAIY